jgi:hypothetical protein
MTLFSVNAKRRVLHAFAEISAPVPRGHHLLLPLNVFETYERTILGLYVRMGMLSIVRESEEKMSESRIQQIAPITQNPVCVSA